MNSDIDPNQKRKTVIYISLTSFHSGSQTLKYNNKKNDISGFMGLLDIMLKMVERKHI